MYERKEGAIIKGITTKPIKANNSEMQSDREMMMPNLKEKAARTRNHQERSVPKFLKKIFFILEENKHSEFVAWSNDGSAMIVKKPKEFAEKILPQYFKHNNLASFIRQLNMYNFKKKKNYNYDHAYSHEMFQKGRIDLLRNIQRKAIENTPTLPSIATDLKACKEDIEISVDDLIQENLQNKSLHKALLTQVHIIENKMRDLKNEIQVLHSDQGKLKANEQFLKKVVKSLARSFGAENIRKVIEAQGIEFPLDFQGSNERKPVRSTNVKQNCNPSTYYGSDDYSDEMDGVYTQQPSSDYAASSEYSGYEQPYVESSQNNAAHQMKEEYDQITNLRSHGNEMYANWFEKQQFNVDAFLGAGDHDQKHLDADDLFSNPLIPKTRF